MFLTDKELIEINDEIRYSEVEIIGAELREAMESMKAIIQQTLIYFEVWLCQLAGALLFLVIVP